MKKDSTKTHDITELNTLYNEGETADSEVFAEQRSNLLLVAGNHYSKKQNGFYKRLRDSKELSSEQRLRLTKNHIQKICKLYGNNIISMAPGVGFEPKDEQSIQNQKASELHHSVWQDACQRYDIESSLIDQWCDDFIQVGETHVKLFWDPSLGDLKAYEQKVDGHGAPVHIDAMGEETTEPVDMMTGQPHELAADESLPVFTGSFVFEEVYGFNLIREASAKTLLESSMLCVRKMVDTTVMKERYRNDPEKAKLFVDSSDETYMVFDASRSGYKKVTGQVMVREFYFRKCHQYPTGYFFLTTKEGIFEHGPLPGGIFPIVSESYEKVQTTPRGRSPVKHMRPYQVEINRAASKIAEHQVTLGDDKLLIQNGTKISAGVALPGVRSVNYTGSEPGVLAGRAGDQYLTYMQSQITELYMVMNVQEDGEKSPAQLDPYAMLFMAARQKKTFQRPIKKFEHFLMNVCKTYLSLARIHLPDDQIIHAIGKSEQVNIAEFKSSSDILYDIKVEAQADDVESKMGKQLVLNHVLQYVGPQMKSEDIGKIMRQMPYANFDGSFDDMTIDFDSIKNDILALDRGEQPPIDPTDEHVYAIKRLMLRKRKPDFKFLPPQIQMAYSQRISQHQQMEAQRQLTLQRAEQGYIPTGGALLGCDFFVADPADPSKTRRARLPSESIQWLVKHIESQGQSLEQIESMSGGGQEGIAQNMVSMGGGLALPSQSGGSHTSSIPPPSMMGQHPR